MQIWQEKCHHLQVILDLLWTNVLHAVHFQAVIVMTQELIHMKAVWPI